MSDKLVDPAPYALLAESYALAAEWRISHNESPKADVVEGLAMADRALARNPHHATALAMRGRLLRARARTAGDAPVEEKGRR